MSSNCGTVPWHCWPGALDAASARCAHASKFESSRKTVSAAMNFLCQGMDCFTRNREYNKRRTPLRRLITQPSRNFRMAESCSTAPAAERAPLKNELQSQLQDASIVRCIGLQKTIGPQGIGEAADGAHAARRSGAAAQVTELSVIEDVEGFSAELQSYA